MPFSDILEIMWENKEDDLFYQKGVEEGLEKGLEKGEEIGLEKGIELERDIVIENLLRKKRLTIEEIADATNVSIEYVLKIDAKISL